MAATIRRETQQEVILFKGRLGAFEVKLGDRLIFSKLGARRFPKSGEVLKGLQEALPK